MTFFVEIQIDLRERFIYAPVNIARRQIGKYYSHLIPCTRGSVTNFLKWEFHSAFISFTRAPFRQPTRDSIFRTVFRVSVSSRWYTFPVIFFFFLISCLVSFVPWWNHAFVIHNHSIYLRAEKSGLRTSLYTDIWSVKNVQLIRRREKGRMKIWSSKANRFAVSAKINI